MPDITRLLRRLLVVSGPINLIGAICFAPPFPFARQMAGLPEPEPFYLWVLSSWILAFGAAYFWQGWTGNLNPGMLATGAFGKLTFAVSLISYGIGGTHPFQAIFGALPDLTLALLFAFWLYVKSRGGRS